MALAACSGSSASVKSIPTAVPSRVDGSPAATLDAPRELGYEFVLTAPSATFDEMLALATVPGSPDEAVVLTQGGQAWRVSLTDETPAVLFADVRDRMIENHAYEEGLLGIAFSPDFAADQRVFLYYTAGGPRRSVISWFLVEDDVIDPASEHIVMEVPQPAANHNGGQLAFGRDGYLYIALGDGGGFGDPNDNAQDLGTLLGSILRIDVSGEEGYRVPTDNPFVSREGARPEIYAYGFRNPWRFSFDRATADLWAGDVGEGKWEEADRVRAGGNYGWKIVEGPDCFGKETCSRDGLIPPRAAYSHDDGCVIVGGYVYRGEALPELAGWYVYGDFCSGKVWAVNTADDSPPVLLAETGLPISSFAELPDGELVVTTFLRGIGKLVHKQ